MNDRSLTACTDLRVRANSGRWHTLRNTGLGASDIAGVLGWSPYTSRTRLYFEKTGALPPTPADERMAWGQRSERMILEKFREDRPDLDGFVFGRMYRSNERAFALATPDAVCWGDDVPYVVEAKNVHGGDVKQWGRDGSDEVPLHYRCQVLWQMYVTGARTAFMPVLFGGNRFRVYEVGYDEDDVRILLAAGKRFWRMVEDRVPPEPDGHGTTTNTLRSAFDVTDQVVEIPESLVEKMNRARAVQRRADKYAAKIENQVRQMVGDARVAVAGDLRRAVVSRSEFTQERFDVAAFREDYPDLAAKYMRQENRRRFAWKG